MNANLQKIAEEYLKKRGYTKTDRFYKFELETILQGFNRAKAVLKKVMQIAKINLKNKKILDAGCGAGGLVVACAKEGANATGIDLDKSKIQLASIIIKKEKEKAKIVYGDLNEKLFNPESFDVIFSIDSLEHVKGENLIRNLAYYTKKGGYMILKVNNKLFPFDPHTKTFFVHFLPARIVDSYLKRFYPSFFKEYKSYSDINLPTYFKLKKTLKKFPALECKIYPTWLIWAEGVKIFRSGLLNKAFVAWPSYIIGPLISSRLFIWFSQSWVIICRKV